MRTSSVRYKLAVWNDNRLVFNELHGFGSFDGYLMKCRLNRTRDEY